MFLNQFTEIKLTYSKIFLFNNSMHEFWQIYTLLSEHFHHAKNVLLYPPLCCQFPPSARYYWSVFCPYSIGFYKMSHNSYSSLCNSSMLLNVIVYNSIVQIYCHLFIHSQVYRHLDCFKFLAIMKMLLWTFIYMSLDLFLFSLGKYQGVESTKFLFPLCFWLLAISFMFFKA